MPNRDCLVDWPGQAFKLGLSRLNGTYGIRLASSPYWRSVQEPCRIVFEACRCTCSRTKLGWDMKLSHFQVHFVTFMYISSSKHSQNSKFFYEIPWQSSAHYTLSITNMLKQCDFMHVAAATLVLSFNARVARSQQALFW